MDSTNKNVTRNTYSQYIPYRYKTTPKRIVWSFLCSTTMLILYHNDLVGAVRRGRIMVPNTYVALSGDLNVQLEFYEMMSPVYLMEINMLTNSEERKLVERFRIYPDDQQNITKLSIRCQNFFQGGKYELVLIEDLNNNTLNELQDHHIEETIEVGWPIPKLSVIPELIGTYPDKPVEVTLTFPEVRCDTEDANNELAEFWLEVIYCGQNLACNVSSSLKSQVLYAEQIRGLPSSKKFYLRCELFGIAGRYIVQLRPTSPTPAFVSAYSFISADWNERFVFNVHARSIFPCDPHVGVGVLFEYPSCILDQADRVRLFARLRADVNSLKPPTSLHYVTEQRIVRGQHSTYFDCNLFSEKYVEYCFTYVSQAISGAVADIRVDCVPTLPVRDLDTGRWGPWSDWTPCSTTCSGGTRTRYRFCDSPPPLYGAKFCEGSAVETEYCGKSLSDAWDCLYESSNLTSVQISTNNADVFVEMEQSCRCGCIIHLAPRKRTKMVASPAQSCPGRSFWLFKANMHNQVILKMNFIRLTCPGQYVKVRDGDALSSNLIAEYSGEKRIETQTVISTYSKLLVEFFSDETASKNNLCNGRFLAYIHQIDTMLQNTTTKMKNGIFQNTQFTTVHITALVFAIIIILISALLGIQYIIRYRKYQLTEYMAEGDSLAQTPRTSIRSLCDSGSIPSRAISTSTLLSEVAYLVKIRPRLRVKHSILRESIIAETILKGHEINYCIEDPSKSMESDMIESAYIPTKEFSNPSNKSVQQLGILSLTEDEKTTDFEYTLYNDFTKREKDMNTDQPLDERNQRTYIDNRMAEQLTSNPESLLSESKASSFSSIATLTNGSYSPAVNTVCTAKIRPTNQKENKEKQNRQKLLVRPGSEFSLANPEDFELDYYDYNVVNAGAAPGSYLGMDPAYLVWIPPLEAGSIIHDDEKDTLYDEILQQSKYVDAGSNKETPDYEISTSSSILESENSSRDNNLVKNNFKNSSITTDDYPSALVAHLNRISGNEMPLNESNKINAKLTQFQRKQSKDDEKETTVEKFPRDNLGDYYELDGIQFADDDAEGEFESNY